MKPQAAARPTTVAIVLEESYRRIPTTLGHLLEDLLRAVTALVALAAVALWWLTATSAARRELVTRGWKESRWQGRSRRPRPRR
jgi:hypothetical protein